MAKHLLLLKNLLSPIAKTFGKLDTCTVTVGPGKRMGFVTFSDHCEEKREAFCLQLEVSQAKHRQTFERKLRRGLRN